MFNILNKFLFYCKQCYKKNKISIRIITLINIKIIGIIIKMISEEELDYVFKVIFLGDSSVGKSNIILKYYKNIFYKNSKSTVGVEFYSKVITTQENKNIKIQIWDTAGQERFKSITTSYYKGAKGAIIVYDITRRGTFDNVREWYKDIKSMADNTNIVIMLIGNKCDLINERVVSTEEGKREAEMNGMAFMETSALDGTNIQNAFEEMALLICKKQVSLGNLGLRDSNSKNNEEICPNSKNIEVNKKDGEKKVKCCE